MNVHSFRCTLMCVCVYICSISGVSANTVLCFNSWTFEQTNKTLQFVLLKIMTQLMLILWNDLMIRIPHVQLQHLNANWMYNLCIAKALNACQSCNSSWAAKIVFELWFEIDLAAHRAVRWCWWCPSSYWKVGLPLCKVRTMVWGGLLVVHWWWASPRLVSHILAFDALVERHFNWFSVSVLCDEKEARFALWKF